MTPRERQRSRTPCNRDPIPVRGTGYNGAPIRVRTDDGRTLIVPAGDVRFSLDRARRERPGTRQSKRAGGP